jgi:predicted NACHT family NTPase
MAERSLRATPEGIHKAKKVVKNNGWTQTEIGEQVGTTRQPIGKFFAGKPIERPTFIDICRLLGLNWEDIAEPEPVEQNQNTSIDIEALVQEVREKIKPDIQERCGTMRVLDMSQPIGLNDIYTNVNILERITGRRRKEIAELLQECNSEDFERFELGRISEERVPGLEAVEKYSKLMILGKPGAGKTTFLKYLAILCNNGNDKGRDTVGAGLGNNSRRPQTRSQQNPPSQPSPSTDNLSTKPALFCLVPIFVTLKDFADAANKPGLLEYISQQFSDCGFVGAIHESPLQDVIKYGRALVLLDGLDEVREEDNSRVLKEIRDFSEQFRDNHFVMTCRIAAREYTFEKFTEVEVADFDDEQISTFATKWFKNKAVKAETFIKRLEDNDRIKQLAASPLLLTLLCLAFEESGDFPANRSELYKEGLDALLKKWDAKRGIYRDQVYKKLSVQRKEELLSKIALTTFERGDYFFKQKVAEQYIIEYIRNLPDANAE